MNTHEEFTEYFKPTREESERAKLGFEKMARRLDELWSKDKLTLKESKEVELIMNNATVVDEMIRDAESSRGEQK